MRDSQNLRHARPGESGSTLAELLVAVAILSIGLLGVTGALGIQSGGIAAGMSTGGATVTRGYYESVATMMAQERLEQVKQLQYTAGPPAVDQFGADPIPAGFADENAGTIAGFPNFARQVRVTTGVPAANMKTITVTVTFSLPTAQRINPAETVSLSTLLARRP